MSPGAGEGGGSDREIPTAVVAIGGNALSPEGEPPTVANQFRHTRESLVPVVRFARQGWNVAIVHGNGPQVGDELRRNEVARHDVSQLPLGVLVASTAGWIGYMIQQSLQNALAEAGADRRVVTVVTQARVDPEDPLLSRPSKFVGRAVGADAVEAVEGRFTRVARDDGGTLRRRVPSPVPLEIVESEVVRALVDAGVLVVAAGGGGIPVYRDPALGLEGLDVVIDKDRSAALLAREIDADLLLVLTDVDGVYRDFGTPDARKLDRLTLQEARAMLDGAELGEGSMEPKVEAAVSYLESGGGRAVIAALPDAAAAADGRAGTELVTDGADGAGR